MAEPERITALKTAANVLRQTVRSSDERLAPLFGKMANAITTKTALQADLAKPHILTHLLEAMSAAGISGGGFAAGGIGGGIQGATAAAIYKLFTSTPGQTTFAVGLDRLGNIGASKGVAGLNALTRVGTQRAIQESQRGQ